MTDQPPTGADRFVVGRHLGSGGMGTVHVATDTRFDRLVALKVMSSRLAGGAEFRARFLREAQVLAKLDSPHVTTIHDHGDDDGSLWIATQLVRGGDLGAHLERHGPMDPHQAVQLCRQVATALVATHAVGVLHRDVKPGNVLLHDPEARPLHIYLCDFGVADTGAERLTVAGGVTGTWKYLAPERVHGAAAAPTTDIYAVGCLLWACLTGRPPYDGSDVDIVVGHMEGAIPQVAETGPGMSALNDALRRMLAKDPAERVSSAAELRDLLTDVARVVPVSAPPVTPALAPAALAPDAPGSRRRAFAALLASVLITGIAVGAGVLASGDPGTAPGPLVSSDRGATRIAVTSDFDGDGLGDFALSAVKKKLPTVRPMLNEGSSFTPATTFVDGFHVIRGDIDGNGAEELVAVDSGTDPSDSKTEFPGSVLTVTVHGPDGPVGATYPLDGTSKPTPVFSGPVMLADIDGDGRDDLVIARPDYGTGKGLHVWVAQSRGDRFAPFEEAFVGAKTAKEVVAADIDGDGDDDLVLTDDDGAMAVLDAGALPLVLGEFTPVNTDADEVLVADPDGDGQDELVAVGVSGSPQSIVVIDRVSQQWEASVWLHDGDGRAGLLGTPLATAVSDVDGDGRDDLVRFRYRNKGKAVGVRVFISSGSDFALPVDRGQVPCAGCNEYFNAVLDQLPY